MFGMPSITQADAQGLCSFVDASPSPFHVCATVAAELATNGFAERVFAVGATEVHRENLDGFRWVVFADPQGNQFCVSGER